MKVVDLSLLLEARYKLWRALFILGRIGPLNDAWIIEDGFHLDSHGSS